MKALLSIGILSILTLLSVTTFAQGNKFKYIPKESFVSQPILVNDVITIQLLNSVIYKDSRLFSQDEQVGVKYTITFTGSGQNRQVIDLAQLNNVASNSDGRNFIASRYNVLRNLKLKTPEYEINSLKLDISILRKEGSTRLGFVFDKIVGLTNSANIPANPFSSTVAPYLNLINQLVSPANPDLENSSVSDATYEFNFGQSIADACDKTGYFALINSADETAVEGWVTLDIGMTDDYDFIKTEDDNIKVKKKGTDDYCYITNTYLLFYVTKQSTN